MTVKLPYSLSLWYLGHYLLTSPAFLCGMAMIFGAVFAINALGVESWPGNVLMFLAAYGLSVLTGIRPVRVTKNSHISLTTTEKGLILELEKNGVRTFHPWSLVIAKRRGDSLHLTLSHSHTLKLSLRHLEMTNKAALTAILHTHAGKAKHNIPEPLPTDFQGIASIPGSVSPTAAACNAERSAENRVGRRYALIALTIFLFIYCLQIWAVPAFHTIQDCLLYIILGALSLCLLLPHRRRNYCMDARVRSNENEVLIEWADGSWQVIPLASLYNACEHPHGLHYDTPFIPHGISVDSAIPGAPKARHPHPYRNSLIHAALLYLLAFICLHWIETKKGYHLYLGSAAYALQDSAQPEASQEQIRGALALIMKKNWQLGTRAFVLAPENHLQLERTAQGNFIFTIEHREQQVPTRILIGSDGAFMGMEYLKDGYSCIVNGGIDETPDNEEP